MGTFPQTRAAAGYIARHARGELARGRAAVLLTRLDACEHAPAGGDVPAVFHGVLRDLVLAARDLAGPAWLAAASHDPDIAAFTALQATPVPAFPGRTRRDHLPGAAGPLRPARPRPRRRLRPRASARPRNRARYSSPQPRAGCLAQSEIPGRGSAAGTQGEDHGAAGTPCRPGRASDGVRHIICK